MHVSGHTTSSSLHGCRLLEARYSSWLYFRASTLPSFREILFSLVAGKIPEWRGRYSRLWAIRNLPKEYSLIYNFVYSAECLFFADWISKIKKIPIIVHIADHSISFEQKRVRNIISRAKQLICITDEMKCRYEKMLGRRDVAVLHNGAEEECSEIPLPSNLVFSQSTPLS